MDVVRPSECIIVIELHMNDAVVGVFVSRLCFIDRWRFAKKTHHQWNDDSSSVFDHLAFIITAIRLGAFIVRKAFAVNTSVTLENGQFQ